MTHFTSSILSSLFHLCPPVPHLVGHRSLVNAVTGTVHIYNALSGVDHCMAEPAGVLHRAVCKDPGLLGVSRDLLVQVAHAIVSVDHELEQDITVLGEYILPGASVPFSSSRA